MVEIVEKFEHNGWMVTIVPDMYPDNPREDYDHIATMACAHRRYTLGDNDGDEEARRAISASRDFRVSWANPDSPHYLDDHYHPDLWKAIQRCSDIVSLPLFLYDHSGITMNTTGFSCPWDSGQVGFIFITKEDILKEWGEPLRSQRLTPKLKEAAIKCMEAEVVEYDAYISGDMYGVKVTPIYDGDDIPDEDEESIYGICGIDAARECGREFADERGAAPAK